MWGRGEWWWESHRKAVGRIQLSEVGCSQKSKAGWGRGQQCRWEDTGMQWQVESVCWSCLCPFLPSSLPHHPLSVSASCPSLYCLFFVFLIIHWVQFVVSICTWVWGHQLECGGMVNLPVTTSTKKNDCPLRKVVLHSFNLFKVIGPSTVETEAGE